MDLRLPLPTVHFRAEIQFHVGIVEAALITTSEIVRLDQVHVQVRFIEIVSQAQMKSAQLLPRPAIIAVYAQMYMFISSNNRVFFSRNTRKSNLISAFYQNEVLLVKFYFFIMYLRALRKTGPSRL